MKYKPMKLKDIRISSIAGQRIKMRTALILGCILIIGAVYLVYSLVQMLHEFWRNNISAIIGSIILLIFLYPMLYSFVFEIRQKNKKIREILKNSEHEQAKQKLLSFEFYTFARFMAEVIRQLSSIWIFILLQVMLSQVPELVTANTAITLKAYWHITMISLMLCLGVFIVSAGVSTSISLTSITKKRHIDYLFKIQHIITK